MEVEGNETAKRVCVTRAAGYIGSWLVKNLLERSYTVNATLRNPGDETKSGPLLKLPGAQERLNLFKADLCIEGSFDSAVKGCHGVFHVASPMDFTKPNPDDFIVSAVNGVQNVMKACVRAKSVRRFVYTSSTAAASPMNDKGEFTHTCLDGSFWSPINFLKSQTHKVVSILPGSVIGPWFIDTSTVTSAQSILGLLRGINHEITNITMKFGEFMLGCIPIVHIDDTCNAHIFLMEHADAQNRCVCLSESISLKCLSDLLSKKYPQFKNSTKLNEDDNGAHLYLPASSQKMLDMGFSFKYQLQEALDETIESAIKSGLLQL